MVPINNIFSDSFLRDLVFWSSRFQGIVFPDLRERYDVPIYNAITDQIIPKKSGNTILITGHSLGAGL